MVRNVPMRSGDFSTIGTAFLLEMTRLLDVVDVVLLEICSILYAVQSAM